MNSQKITLEDFQELIDESGGQCYYCQRECFILDLRRSKNQITLERLDNEKPHSRENCVIACLGCNGDRSNKFKAKDYKEAQESRRNGDYKKMNSLIKNYYKIKIQNININ